MVGALKTSSGLGDESPSRRLANPEDTIPDRPAFRGSITVISVKTWPSILAAALGVASSVSLYRGSEETPVSTQWYKGTTPEEDKFRRKRRGWAVAGFVLLGAAFAMQAAAALLS